MEDKKRREIKEERTAASNCLRMRIILLRKKSIWMMSIIRTKRESGRKWMIPLTEEMDEDTEADQEENMAEEYAAREEGEKDFANRKRQWKVVFRKHSRKQGTVSVTKDAYKISWALENAKKK